MDKDNATSKGRVIYRLKCTQEDCEEEYIGESGRSFGDRLKEHLRTPSSIYKHGNATGHCISVGSLSTVGKEEHNINRTIKKPMFIRVNDPSLNRNLGKIQLPHIWYEVLHETPVLHLK